MKIQFDEFTPLFIQIIRFIKVEIITGSKKPGEKLPSVRELAKEFEINPNTVQKAYQELEKEGLLRSERGSGNFVTEDEDIIIKAKNEMADEATKDYIKNMAEYGYSIEEIMEFIKKHIKEEP